MKLINKLKSLAVLVFFLSFLSSATLISCGQQGQSDDKDATEHPAEEEEKAEHPEKADEHPADTTKTEQEQQ